MADRIDEQERRRMQSMLATDKEKLWLAVRSESDYARNEIFFWFLIEDQKRIGLATQSVLEKLRECAKSYPKTSFNASLIQLSSSKKIDWESIDDNEIRKGMINRQPGSNSTVHARPEYTVFDRDI